MKPITYFSFFLLVISSVSCKKDVTSISGKITDSWTGSGIGGVSLITDPTSTTISLDASGNYTISDISSGKCIIYVSLAGYVMDTTTVPLTKGKSSTVNISLNSVIGGTWSLSMPTGFTFQFKSDGTFTGSDGSGSWHIASFTTGIVTWTFNYYGSPVTYYGHINSSKTMADINATWSATRQ
jgi:predicted secreted protein